MKKHVRIGIDVGGTFTDLFLVSQASGLALRHKLPSTPEQPHEAPIAGIQEILAKGGFDASEVAFVGLGTTVATNALLERKGARSALVTTRGFRDVLENGRQGRPHVFNLHLRKPVPLITRDLRFELDERIGAAGEVLRPLKTQDVLELIARLRELDIGSVAICFLNSYKNPAHELACAQLFRQHWPEIPVSVSAEVMPEFREFERVSTTAVNAYLMPLMRRYLSSFQAEARHIGVTGTPFVMNSGGGVVSPEIASIRPVDTLLSGPSGGVAAAAYLARRTGHPNIVTFDMGGTSTDVSLLRQHRYEMAQQRVIDGIPFKSNAVDVHSVGAGGSSIAWIDEGELLRVGPQSAGASPGPACHGKGGVAPTVTDANVVLGRLNDRYLLGGKLEIEAEASERAIREAIAGPRKIDVVAAARAIVAVANTNIVQAIRVISVNRGIDPRDFMLVAFGGAGPIHAAEVASELDMKGVIIPPSPGVLCALGVLTKDVRVDTSQTVLLRERNEASVKDLAAAFERAERRARELLQTGGASSGEVRIERSVDARYVGQNHELSVVLDDAAIDDGTWARIRAGFEAAHRELFGYSLSEKETEVVNVRAAAILAVPAMAIATPEPAGHTAPKEIARRHVHFHHLEQGVTAPVFQRDDLTPHTRLDGPAVIEQFDTTTLIPPDFIAVVDTEGNLVLTRSR